MREIGVRELKASLSETLRLVAHGERVRVTAHGRPVADLVPPGVVPADDPLADLVANGRLVPPARARPKRPPRLADAAGPASARVLEERDAER